MTVFCMSCGTQLPLNAKFCKHCGKPQSVCMVCGEQMADDDEFCMNCGTKNEMLQEKGNTPIAHAAQVTPFAPITHTAQATPFAPVTHATQVTPPVTVTAAAPITSYAPAPPVSRPEAQNEQSLAYNYSLVSGKANSLAAPPPVTLSSIRAFDRELKAAYPSEYSTGMKSIFSSLDDAVRFKKLDVREGKSASLIQRLLAVYERIHDKRLLITALFIYEQETNIKSDIFSDLSAGVENLSKYSNGSVCIDYVLSNGLTHNTLPAWNFFQGKPHILVYVIQKGYFKSRKNNDAVAAAVTELANAQYLDISFKNIILFGVLNQLNPGVCKFYADEQQTSYDVSAALRDAVLNELKKHQALAIALSGNTAVDEEDFSVYNFTFDKNSGVPVEAGDAVVLSIHLGGTPVFVSLEKKAYDAKSTLTTLYYKICKSINTNADLRANARDAKRRINILIPNLTQTGSAPKAASPAPVNNTPVKKTASPAGNNTPVKAGYDGGKSYNDIIEKMATVKTPEDMEFIIARLTEFADKSGDSHRLSAVKDLIHFYDRKVVSVAIEDANFKAINVYNTYKNLFAGNAEEKSKLAKVILSVYIKLQDYDNALLCLEDILEVQTNEFFAGNRAFCYLQKKEYENALAAVTAKDFIHFNSVPYAWTIKYAILAYIGLNKLDLAEQELTRLKSISPDDAKINDLAAYIQSEKDDNNEEDVDSFIKRILPNASELNANSIIDETVKPYLKMLLRKCEFDHLRDRLRNEETSEWYWKPTKSSIAKTIISELKKNEANALKSGIVRDSVLKRAYEANLTVAKMSQLCAEEFSTDEAAWSNEFFLGAAKAFWCKARLMCLDDKNGSTNLSDSVMYHFRECVRLMTLYDAKKFENRYEIYDAIAHCVTGLMSAKEAIHPFYESDNDGAQQSLQRLSEFSNRSFGTNAKTSVKFLGRLLVQCPGIKEFILGYLNDIENADALKAVLEDSLEITEPLDINELIDKYLDALRKERELAGDNLSLLRKSLKNDVIEITNIRRLISNPYEHKYFLSDYEYDLYSSLAKNIQIYCDTLTTSSYVDQMTNCDKILLAVAGFRSNIDNSPTDFLFEFMPDIIERLEFLVRQLSDKLYQEHKPVLNIADDYSDERYTPQNNTVSIQLRISNGEDCSQAKNITLSFEENDETKPYYSLQKQIYKCPFWLDGDTERVFEIPIDVTSLGQSPEQLYDIIVRADCTSSRDEKIAGKTTVLTIGIKSDGAFKRIENPYITSPLKPKKNNVFYGRKKEIEQITNSIANKEPSGRTVVIYGQFRSGKTSFANYVRASIEERDSTVIWSNLNINTADSFELLISRIMRFIVNDIKKSGRNIEQLEQYGNLTSMPFDLKLFFLEFLNELKDYSNKHNVHVVLQIDEFGRLYESEKIDSQYFMEIWKEIMETTAFDALLIGHDVLTELLVKNNNAFATSTLLHLNYLDSDDALELIQLPTSLGGISEGRFMKDAVDELQRMTGGAAYYIQLICQQAIDFMNAKEINRINGNYLNICVSKWLASMTTGTIATLFHPLYRSGEVEELAVDDEDAIAVLQAIAFLNKTPERASSNNAILDWLKKNAPESEWDEKRVDNTVLSLKNRWVIDKERNAYYIRVRLYEDYVTKNI